MNKLIIFGFVFILLLFSFTYVHSEEYTDVFRAVYDSNYGYLENVYNPDTLYVAYDSLEVVGSDIADPYFQNNNHKIAIVLPEKLKNRSTKYYTNPIPYTDVYGNSYVIYRNKEDSSLAIIGSDFTLKDGFGPKDNKYDLSIVFPKSSNYKEYYISNNRYIPIATETSKEISKVDTTWSTKVDTTVTTKFEKIPNDTLYIKKEIVNYDTLRYPSKLDTTYIDVPIFEVNGQYRIFDSNSDFN